MRGERPQGDNSTHSQKKWISVIWFTHMLYDGRSETLHLYRVLWSVYCSSRRHTLHAEMTCSSMQRYTSTSQTEEMRKIVGKIRVFSKVCHCGIRKENKVRKKLENRLAGGFKVSCEEMLVGEER